MRAVIFEGNGKLVCRSGVAEPQVSHPRDAIVRVERAGICGSDLHMLEDREPLRVGSIFGHELAGVVVETGNEVTSVSPGDRVFSPFSTSCGDCFFCTNGMSARCVNWQVYGHDDPRLEPDPRGLPGAQAEYVRVPLADSTLVAMPDDMTFEEAILLSDNFSTGWCGVKRACDLCDGPLDVLVIVGCGVVGLSAIAAAAHLGAKKIVVVDPVEYRRNKAREIVGSDCQLHMATPEDATELIRSLTADRGGADAVVEAVGRKEALRFSFEIIRDFGVISSIGAHTEDSPITPAEEYGKNAIRKTGRASVRSCLDEILTARTSGRLAIPVEPLVTDSAVPFEEVQSAYERFQTRTDGCLKIMLRP